jgi:hypothetical protein
MRQSHMGEIEIMTTTSQLVVDYIWNLDIVFARVPWLRLANESKGNQIEGCQNGWAPCPLVIYLQLQNPTKCGNISWKLETGNELPVPSHLDELSSHEEQASPKSVTLSRSGSFHIFAQMPGSNAQVGDLPLFQFWDSEIKQRK